MRLANHLWDRFGRLSLAAEGSGRLLEMSLRLESVDDVGEIAGVLAASREAA